MFKINPVATIRFFLALGVSILAFDYFTENLGLAIPPYTTLYLIISSIYLGFNPQKRVEKRSEEVFSYIFFPGAFVTALLPIFAGMLLLMSLGSSK